MLRVGLHGVWRFSAPIGEVEGAPGRVSRLDCEGEGIGLLQYQLRLPDGILDRLQTIDIDI